ncbi:MAG: demethoxyubiquinone hydroxylase family protein [Alphaproteobacteria bacterium]
MSHEPTTADDRAAARPPRPGPLPGDLSREALIERMVRVDHAGEYGARRIYEGQLAVLGKSPVGDTIRRMWAQEAEHLKTFDRLVVERRVRPTLLHPLWHVAGFALGAASAALGTRAAMAVTVAVEEVIDEHYGRQAEALGEADPELKETVERFRVDEAEHRDTGLEHGATQAPAYPLMSALVKAGSRAAIWLSERI